MKHNYSGWRPSRPDQRDKLFAFKPTTETLPPIVNLNVPALGSPFNPAIDQANLGSCGPNSVTNFLSMAQIQNGDLKPFIASRLFTYYNTRVAQGEVNQDSGVDNRTMFQAIAKYGWCAESLWPYNISKFKSKPPTAAYTAALPMAAGIVYNAVNQDLNTMKACIAGGKPFVFGFTVYDSFESNAADATGDIPMPGKNESVLGGHDILFIGYNDVTQRFDFRNSWGNWGNKGSGTMPYAYATNPDLSSDFWTMTSIGDSPAVPTTTIWQAIDGIFLANWVGNKTVLAGLTYVKNWIDLYFTGLDTVATSKSQIEKVINDFIVKTCRYTKYKPTIAQLQIIQAAIEFYFA